MKSYQEQIIESYEKYPPPDSSINFKTVIRDCWAIARLEKDIELWERGTRIGDTTHFIEKYHTEIASILAKYGLKP